MRQLRHRLQRLEHHKRAHRLHQHQPVVLHVPKTVPHEDWLAWAAQQIRPSRCGDATCPGPAIGALLPENLTMEEWEATYGQ
jgi:hypothetical protein